MLYAPGHNILEIRPVPNIQTPPPKSSVSTLSTRRYLRADTPVYGRVDVVNQRVDFVEVLVWVGRQCRPAGMGGSTLSTRKSGPVDVVDLVFRRVDIWYEWVDHVDQGVSAGRRCRPAGRHYRPAGRGWPTLQRLQMLWLLQLVLGNATSVVAIVSLMNMILIIVTLVIVYCAIVVIIDVITIPLPFEVITILLPFGCFVGAGNSGHGFSFLSKNEALLSRGRRFQPAIGANGAPPNTIKDKCLQAGSEKASAKEQKRRHCGVRRPLVRTVPRRTPP